MSKNQPPFSLYSQYYDLFYNDKQYTQEAEYIIRLIKHYCNSAKEILELGSGSGNFSERFSTIGGFEITGIDSSETMIAQARAKKIPSFTPIKADITSFDLKRNFDAVVSLFDVMSYLTHTDEFLSCLQCVYNHLNKGGYFIFDTWHTAGVYTDPPTKRTKQVENDFIHINRIATPEIHYETNIVDVNYEFQIEDKNTLQKSIIQEKHSLRHFSIVEIEYFANMVGFQLVKSEEPLTSQTPTNNSWKVCHILKRK